MNENPYESRVLLDQYLLFHYGSADETMPFSAGPRSALHFAERVVTETFLLDRIPANARALDLGCAVGCSSFALSRWCSEVVGIDFSGQFIRAAQELAAAGSLAYARAEEGEITTPLLATLPEEARPERVRFQVGDAGQLPSDLGAFEVVLLANLLCRLSEPRQCLDRLPSLVKPGGQLVISSPWTWLDDFTPPAYWLGGKVGPDGPLFSLDTLRETLAKNFHFENVQNLPMLIREHARKYQWSMVQASLWIRR